MARGGVKYQSSGLEWVITSYCQAVTYMFLGEHRHTLDSKKRVAMPAKFRRELGKTVVITHGLDNCLFVYPQKTWAKVAEKLGGLSMGQADTRSFNRFMLAGAVETAIDTMGRVLVPDFLKAFARLGETVVIAGLHDRLEIWNTEQWDSYKQKITSQADNLAQKLGEVGVL